MVVMAQGNTTGNDLVPESADVHVTDNGDALVMMDELDISLGAQGECSHVFWYTPEGPEMDARLYALEPDPETGYWTCCPSCGFMIGQRNLGAIPTELRMV